MRTYHLSAALVAISLLGVAAIGCDGDPGSESTSTVQGRIEANDQIDAESVEAFQLLANGQLVSVSLDGAVAPDAAGGYSIPIELTDGTKGPLIIQAVGADGLSGSVLVTVAADANGVIQAAPIGLESSVEAAVSIELASEANFPLVGTAVPAVALMVDEQTAAAAAAGADLSSDVQALADGVTAATTAFEAALELQSSAASSKLQQASIELAQAHTELEATLHAASNDSEAQVAISAFAQAFFDAYADAGFSAEQIAAAAHAAEAGMTHFSTELTSAAHSSATAHANLVMAIAVASSIHAQMETMQASTATMDSLASAKSKLDSQLMAAITAGGDAATQTSAAWASYAASVDAALKATLDSAAAALPSVDAPAIVQLVADLADSVDAAAGDAPAVGDALANAEVDFFASMTSEAHTTLLTTLGKSNAEATAAFTVLAEIAIASH